MAGSSDYTKETMAETTHQHMNLQQMGYPSYGTQQPPAVITNSPPAYNQPVHIQCGNPPVEQSCCVPPQSHVVNEINDNEGELEDYFKLQPQLKVDFDGVFHEPEHTGGVGFIITYNSSIYYWTKRCLYIFLSCIIGPIMAFTFGLIFALMDFLVIWCLNPSVRLIHVCIRFASSGYRPVARIVLDPIFESFGQMYRVRNSGRFTERKYKLDVSGINLGGINSRSEPITTHQHTA